MKINRILIPGWGGLPGYNLEFRQLEPTEIISEDNYLFWGRDQMVKLGRGNKWAGKSALEAGEGKLKFFHLINE